MSRSTSAPLTDALHVGAVRLCGALEVLVLTSLVLVGLVIGPPGGPVI